jgi:hypothetical protein
MNSETIYDAITDIRDKHVVEADNVVLKKPRFTPAKWAALAASAAIAIGVGGYVAANGLNFAFPFGGSAGGAGHDGGTVFMSYAGPVFPLTFAEVAEGVTAARDIAFDFRDFWETTFADDRSVTKSPSEIYVTDEYVLKNDTASDITASVVYPFAGSFDDLHRLRPALYLDGMPLETELYAGQYSGGFTGVWSGDAADDSMSNLAPLDSWEGYKTLLSDGEYKNAVFTELPPLDTTVIVYEFGNPYAAPSSAISPTLAARFNLDYDKTTVLSYFFNGGEFDPDSGRMRLSFSVPKDGERLGGSDRPYCMVVLGDDISNLTTQGYRNGGCKPGDELEGVTADVTRYEARLGDVLLRLLADFMSIYDMGQFMPERGLEMVLLYRASAELLYGYGALAANPASRYNRSGYGDGLDGIFAEMLHHDRVFYLKAEVSIPAGGSVTLRADMIKAGSFDYYCARTENEGLYGYDTVTKLGSNLAFSALRAELLNPEQIEIARQNFGFDIANGVTAVTLDMNVEHYYMEVRAATGQK